MKNKKEKGVSTVTVLILLTLLSSFFLSLAYLVNLHMHEISRHKTVDDEKERFRKEAERVVELLLLDDTPYADSPDDSIWDSISATLDEELEIELKDISSLLGLNWIRRELFETFDSACELLNQDKNFDEFQDHREETGITLDLISAYEEFIEKDKMDEYFTAYNYFNVNVTAKSVLEKLFDLRGVDPNYVENKIEARRMAREHYDEESFKEEFGADFDKLYPVLNTEAVMNIHFMPEDIVKTVLSHYYVLDEDSEINRDKEVESIASQLVELRETEEGGITIERLKEIIDKNADIENYKHMFIYQYMGNKTWFWSITVQEGGSQEGPRLIWIIARVPQYDDDSVIFRITEEVFIP
jgi:RNAse (barnase) inhibitor barstar